MRKLFDANKIHSAAGKKMSSLHPETIREIEEAIKDNTVVVVGMAQNPHVRDVRNALKEAGIDFKYLEYGSYLSEWKRRLTIKMWTGWPTFPQVFVRGVFIGGTDLTKAAIADGTLLKSKDEEAAAVPA